MATMIYDPALESRLRDERAAAGADRYDEVWEGVYVMAPMPDHEHQRLVARFTRALDEIVTDAQLGVVVPGVNISDRVEQWQTNFRVPDVAVFLNSTKAVNHRTFWCGGPDFAVEIISSGDQGREKIAFYQLVGTRELLLVDQDPWQLELYRLSGSRLELCNAVVPSDESRIRSAVIPLEIGFAAAVGGPRIYLSQLDSDKSWEL